MTRSNGKRGETSGGGDVYLSGRSAAVGYNAGISGDPAGTFGQFTGSLVNGALLDGGPNSLVAGTNDNVTGQYLFAVRNGTVVGTPPPAGVPEPITLSIFGAGVAGAVVLRRRKKSKA